MYRIGIAGVPCSGKTSLARALSGFCITEQRFSKVELTSEYAREYIARYGSIESVWDELLILENQLDWENRFSEVDLTITDSPIQLIYVYALQLKKDSIKDTLVMERILRKINNLGPRYDVVFYLPPVIKPIKDGVRPDIHLDEVWRTKTDGMIKSVFEVFPPKKFVEVKEVEIAKRVDECVNMLRGLK